MTSFKQEQIPEPSTGSQCFDLDSFINYDQTVAPTPSISPLSSRSKSTTPTAPSTQQNNLTPVQPNTQTFAGPSHQYALYRQQAGLPVGALANTFAVNQVDQFGFGRDQLSYGMVPPTDGYFSMNNSDDFLDFGSAPGQNSIGDMDVDFGSPTDLTTPNPDFVNPAAIAEHDTYRNPPQPVRVYPGMHQQAALAKAQAEAQRQQQQQQKQQQQQQPHTTPAHNRQTSSSGSSCRPPTDPIVEESISRLLNQMRHSSVSSSHDDDAATPINGSQSHGRVRKDEEDMDEDERLLASEEGKKLSSKERRQLRNKVSARAFRSRRKGIYVFHLKRSDHPANVCIEYIGQLEGEIAAKQTEADELRLKNEELAAENTRLTDLTRMLLSSPAFSNFLNALSGTGAPVSIPELASSQSHTSMPASQSATSRKDVNPNQVTTRQTQGPQQNNMHVGMTIIPEESSFNFNAGTAMNTGYHDNADFGGLYDAQVYAITSVPEGPAVDSYEFNMLHGKSSDPFGSHFQDCKTKVEPIAIESLKAANKVEMPQTIDVPDEEDDIDISDPAFALFIDQPSTSAAVAPEDRIFGDIELEKAFGRVELVVIEDEDQTTSISSVTIDRFQRLCARLDASSASIAAITGCPW